MSRLRTPIMLVAAVAGTAGIYLYTAGGDPKAAEKKFARDVHSATAEVKSHVPMMGPSAEKNFKDLGAKAGSELDQAYSKVKTEASAAKHSAEAMGDDLKAKAFEAKHKADAMGADVRDKATKDINAFDRKVQDTAASAKSGVSSWFGASK